MNRRLVALLLAFLFTGLSAKAQYNPPAGGVTQIVAGSGVTISPPGGTGAVTVNATGGGGGSPAGSTTQVQYNNAGVFGADSGFTRNPSTKETNIQKLLETTIQGAFHLGTTTIVGGSNLLGAFNNANDTSSGSGSFVGAGDFTTIGQTTTTAGIGSYDSSGNIAGVFVGIPSGTSTAQMAVQNPGGTAGINVTATPSHFQVTGLANSTQFTVDDSAQTYTFNKFAGFGTRNLQIDNSGVMHAVAPSNGSALTLTSTSDVPIVTVPICTVVYSDGAGTFSTTTASSSNATKIIGLVYDSAGIASSVSGNLITSGLLVATTAQWDAVVTGESGGLTAGTLYYLDPSTAGFLTTTAPSTSGKYVAPIGLALSSTNMLVRIGPTTLL